MSSIVFIPASSAPGAPGGGYTYEYVNKNISSFNNTLTYSSGKLQTVTYDLGGGLSIVKTLTYSGNKLQTVVLSGDTPLGILLTKTFSYTGNNLTGVTYS